MKNRLFFLLLGFSASILQAEWLYVNESPWIYEPSSNHWMYALPMYRSLEYLNAELIFSPENPDFSHRWLYTGYLPWVYDKTDDAWYWYSRSWACENTMTGTGGESWNWISLFDPLGKTMVPDQLWVDTEFSLGYFVQAFTTHLVALRISARAIEADGEIRLLASHSGHTPKWLENIDWHGETEVIYEKVSEESASLAIPEFGVRIEMELWNYRIGSYRIFNSDGLILSQSSGVADAVTIDYDGPFRAGPTPD